MAADTAQPDSLGVRLCARLHVQTWVGSRSFSWADCTRLPQETVASRAFEQCCIQPDPTASRVLQRGGCLQPLRAQPAPHRPGFILFPSSPRGTFQVSSLGNSSLKGNSSFTGGRGRGTGSAPHGTRPCPISGLQSSRQAILPSLRLPVTFRQMRCAVCRIQTTAALSLPEGLVPITSARFPAAGGAPALRCLHCWFTTGADLEDSPVLRSLMHLANPGNLFPFLPVLFLAK